jgi:hypothetical protein
MINPVFNSFRIKILFFYLYKNAYNSRTHDEIATEWIQILDTRPASVSRVPPTLRSYIVRSWTNWGASAAGNFLCLPAGEAYPGWKIVSFRVLCVGRNNQYIVQW